MPLIVFGAETVLASDRIGSIPNGNPGALTQLRHPQVRGYIESVVLQDTVTARTSQNRVYCLDYVKCVDQSDPTVGLVYRKGPIPRVFQWLFVLFHGSDTTQVYRVTHGEEGYFEVFPGITHFANGTYYRYVLQEPVISKNLSDDTFGVLLTGQVSFSLDNSKETLTSFLNTTDLREFYVSIFRYDLEQKTSILEFTGVIDSYSFGDVITIEASSLELGILQKLVPRLFVDTSIFPFAHEDSLGKVLPIHYGLVQKVPCPFVGQYEDITIPDSFVLDPSVDKEPCYDYLVGYGNYEVFNVYRDGLLVNPIEYRVLTGLYQNCTIIRFYTSQTDLSNRLYTISADIQAIYPFLEPTSLGVSTPFSTFLPLWVTKANIDKYSVKAVFPLQDKAGLIATNYSGSNVTGGYINYTNAQFRVPSGLPSTHIGGFRTNGSAYVSIPGTVGGLHDLTANIWFSILFRCASNTETNYANIVTKCDGNNGFQLQIQPSTGSLRIRALKGGTVVSETTTPQPAGILSSGSWFWVFVTIDSVRIRVYINGYRAINLLNSLSSGTLGGTTVSLNLGGAQAGGVQFNGDLMYFILGGGAPLDSIPSTSVIACWLEGLLADYKFTGNTQDCSIHSNHLTVVNGPVQYDKGCLGVSNTAINFATSPLNCYLELSAEKSTRLKNLLQHCFIVRFSVYHTPVVHTTNLPGPVIQGPHTTWDTTFARVTNGWGIYYTGTSLEPRYTISVQRGSESTAWTLTTPYLRLYQWYTITLIVDPVSVSRIYVYLDSTLLGSASISQNTHIRYSSTAEPFRIGSIGSNRRWYVKLDHLSIRVGSLNTDLERSSIFWNYYRTHRNGVVCLRDVLYSAYWGLAQFVDSESFKQAAIQWADINGGEGLPIDMSILESTTSKDVLDSILRLRGGYIWRDLTETESFSWFCSLNTKTIRQAYTPILGQGVGLVNNLLQTPVIQKPSLFQAIRQLVLKYRKVYDDFGGEGEYACSITMDINPSLVNGQVLEIGLNSLRDHRAAYLTAQYMAARIKNVQTSVTVLTEDHYLRDCNLGDLLILSIPRWSHTSKYQILQLTFQEGQAQAHAVQFLQDPATYVPPFPSVISDGTKTSLVTIPVTDYTVVAAPVTTKGDNPDTFAYEFTVAKKVTWPLGTGVSHPTYPFLVKSKPTLLYQDILAENDGDESYVYSNSATIHVAGFPLSSLPAEITNATVIVGFLTEIAMRSATSAAASPVYVKLRFGSDLPSLWFSATPDSVQYKTYQQWVPCKLTLENFNVNPNYPIVRDLMIDCSYNLPSAYVTLFRTYILYKFTLKEAWDSLYVFRTPKTSDSLGFPDPYNDTPYKVLKSLTWTDYDFLHQGKEYLGVWRYWVFIRGINGLFSQGLICDVNVQLGQKA